MLLGLALLLAADFVIDGDVIPLIPERAEAPTPAPFGAGGQTGASAAPADTAAQPSAA